MISVLAVLLKGRFRPLVRVFFDPLSQAPLAFTHIRGRAVPTLDPVDHTCFVIQCDLVLRLDQYAPDGVIGPHVDCHASLSDVLSHSV